MVKPGAKVTYHSGLPGKTGTGNSVVPLMSSYPFREPCSFELFNRAGHGYLLWEMESLMINGITVGKARKQHEMRAMELV